MQKETLLSEDANKKKQRSRRLAASGFRRTIDENNQVDTESDDNSSSDDSDDSTGALEEQIQEGRPENELEKLRKDFEDHLEMFPARIPAYALHQKKWCHVLLDNLSEIIWDDNAFDDLQMEPSRKAYIRRLVSGHQKEGSSTLKFNDIVSGKSKGLIFLLGG